jgi:hypothetical protein
MFAKKLPLVSLLIILVSCNGCQKVQKTVKNCGAKSMVTQNKPITVIIHGTSQSTNVTRVIPPLHSLCARNFRTPCGFLHLDDLPKDHAFRALASALHEKSPQEFPLETFYFFGWSGALSHGARKKAAADLHACLTGFSCPVTLITHSHGGNVALNLACILENGQQTFCIERLILLACPVQDITENHVHSSLFKKIYSFYSAADILQVADPQAIFSDCTWPQTSLFSRREFKNAPHVTQVKIKSDGRSLSHLAFIRPKFFRCLPDIIKILEHPENKELLPRTAAGSYCLMLGNHKNKKRKKRDSHDQPFFL